jgi:hypothetical protein
MRSRSGKAAAAVLDRPAAAHETVGKVAILMERRRDAPQRLLDLEFPEVRQTFARRDTILYALDGGTGCGPLDPKQVRFVHEKNLADPEFPFVCRSEEHLDRLSLHRAGLPRRSRW